MGDLELELAEERQFTAKLADRVQQQARELQQKHAELKELVEYKVLCERRILELQPKHELPVRREQLGADEPPAEDAPGGRPVVDSTLPTHMLSTLAQRRREYEDLLSRYRSLESNGKKTHEKLAEANRALRDLRGAMESREKDHQAAQRKIETLSKKLTVVERHSKANEDYVNKMQRKFATGSQGTLLLRKNAILQKRLEEADAEKGQLALQLRNEAEEETNRQEYIAHLRKALDMKASDFGLKPGQSDVLQELARLRSSYRSTLQEVASYEDRCAAQEQTIDTLREQVSDLRREETALQGQLNDTLSRSRTVASERSNAHSQVEQLRAQMEALSTERAQLVALVDDNVEKQMHTESALQACRQQLEESERETGKIHPLEQNNEALQAEVDRLKGSLAPLEAEVMGRRLEVDELSQHLQAKVDEVSESTKRQAELLDAAQDAKTERKQLESELHDLAQARAADAQVIARSKSERDDMAAQLRAKDEQLQQVTAEVARLRRRLEAKSSELDSRATMTAYIDGKFKSIADIVHRHPECTIGAATQDVCKRIIKLEAEVRALADLVAYEDGGLGGGSGGGAASDVEASAARQHKLASQIESLVASCGALSRHSTQLVADTGDEKVKVAADTERRILEAETAAREAAEEAEDKVRETESRIRIAEEQVSSSSKQITQLEEEVASLRGELSQGRVDGAKLSKLQSEYENSRQLFSSKSQLLETKANSALKDKKEADKRVKDLEKQLDELFKALKEQEMAANREREMLEANATDAATENTKLEQRIQDMEADARRHSIVAGSMVRSPIPTRTDALAHAYTHHAALLLA
jgi:chromosome segregation ATPase